MRQIANRVGFLLVIMCLLISAYGQGPECLFVHFDKSFYVSGETIWFKVYRQDTSNFADSRILHVDLVNHENETIAKQKLLIRDGGSSGSIKLPIDSKEGYYRFRAFTRFNLNFNPPIIYSASIPVYSIGGDWKQHVAYTATSEISSDSSDIRIFTDKEIYHPRDSITVSFELVGAQLSDSSTNYSISVVPSDLMVAKFNLLECPDLSPVGGRLRLPEKSLFVEGAIRDAESKKEVSSRLLSIYSEKTSQLLRASANKGKLKIAIPDYWGEGVFQILNMDPYSSHVLELVPTSGLAEEPYYNQTLPRRSARVNKYVNQLKKRRKVIELFNLYKYPTTNAIPVEIKKADATYNTQDYTKIFSLEQFINQVISNVKVRVIDNKKSVRLFNREMGKLFVDHPWYLVDGFLTYNETEVLAIPYQDIVEIKLYSKTSTLTENFQGFMLRSGVMEITTRDVKYVRQLKDNPNIVEIEGFAQSQDFGHSLMYGKNKRVPDLRGIMFWSPEIYTDAHGAGQITFPLSDDTGKYSIIIVGQNNKHQTIAGYSGFEIQID